MDFGHSWYFYDKIQKKYFMTQDLAKYWLRDLMAIENPDKRPLTIIGFSQGGYLAPVVGKELPETKLIIGIACEFRTTLIHEAPHFPMVALHGEKDEIVKIQEARSESENLKPLGIEVDFRRVPEAAHEITPEMGGMIKNILEFYGTRSL